LDTDGTPIFPEVDLDATPAATVASTIKQFVRRLWGKSGLIGSDISV
jgi:hypothetical protein